MKYNIKDVAKVILTDKESGKIIMTADSIKMSTIEGTITLESNKKIDG